MVTWQPIKTAPKDQMFIWAKPRGNGKWSLGLAYWTVSGYSRDAYGAPEQEEATHWMPLPPPPSTGEAG